jgi:hypothetical protein
VIKQYMQEVDGGAYKHVPIISNGNIITWDDCIQNLRNTDAEGKDIFHCESLYICTEMERDREGGG